MRRFKALFVICLVLNSTLLFGQKDSSNVKWLSFTETKSLFETKQKPVLIYFHDSKNDSCKFMNDETFGLDEVSNYINVLFYPIKFDIYSKEDIVFFNNNVYSSNAKKDGIHSLVSELLGTEIRLPSMILFSRKAEGAVFQGFKDRDNIFPILIYYAESLYEDIPYSNFEVEYFKVFPIGQKQIITRLNIQWKTLQEALDLNKVNPKKIIINLYDNYSISSTMMRLQTYNNSINATYLNEKFYVVNLDIKSEEEFEFLGQTFINEKLPHGFHQLPIALLNGTMKTPAFVIFDENLTYIGKEQRYFTPEDFEALIKYVGDDDYKTLKFEDYKRNFKSTFK
jgi:thioredoxin-related protein